MKKDLSKAIKKLNGMTDCDVVGTREMAEIFGMNPNGMGVTLKTTQFTRPDVKSGRYSFWSKVALSAEIARRQEKMREQDTVTFYARLSPRVAEFARKMGGGGWFENLLKKEMAKQQKTLDTILFERIIQYIKNAERSANNQGD